MASNKRQFLAMYQQAVQLLRNFKQKNDNINKSIGIQHDNSISFKIKAQQGAHKQLLNRIDKLLEKLQQSYLDPDTARKIGTIKQQYKIQKDRRQHLIQSLSQMTNVSINNSLSDQIPYQSQNYIGYSTSTAHNRTHPPIPSVYSQQISTFDYQIQRKILTQKNNTLKQVEHSILNVYNITKDNQQLVRYQGEELDIISDQLMKANRNAVFAVGQLKQANQYHKSSRKKYLTISLILLLIMAVVIAVCVI